MSYYSENPIVALAGAAASNGNRMFAHELLGVDTGRKSVERIKDKYPSFAGMLAIHVAQVYHVREMCKSW